MPESEDDLSIPNDEVLWRRIWPDWISWSDSGSSTTRPKSVAFQDRLEGKVSVSIARETTASRLLRCYPEHSLAAISASVPRKLGYFIVRRPTKEDPAHAVIFPSPTKANARRIAEQARWTVLRNPKLVSHRVTIQARKVWKKLTILSGSPCPKRELGTKAD